MAQMLVEALSAEAEAQRSDREPNPNPAKRCVTCWHKRACHAGASCTCGLRRVRCAAYLYYPTLRFKVS